MDINAQDHEQSSRKAGILLHISSLPSAFGTGDLGPEARRFADFLHRTGQYYWQVLPLNPTEAEQSYSPYSATSSMAGNTLFISPETLADQGLLPVELTEKFKEPVRRRADFRKAETLKQNFLDAAFAGFQKQAPTSLHTRFESFCEKEAFWLNDFALYTALKKENQNAPWHQWPEAYKLRDLKALQTFEAMHQQVIKREKWLQFIFHLQWQDLQAYCHNLGVHIFGDLPFYVSYESADVWANQEIFKLDSKGEMKSIAGVPPDYFNENGQLWGMPVFDWQKLKSTDYDWWVKRIRKNLELYDLVRLDHFRAFASYWEVPAGETTAINGKWKKGPGAEIFKTLQDKFGKLPFVAEDLGDIDEDVYLLRDKYALPGMKVLQFAFEGDMPTSEHIPHNYCPNFIVYTGTHDNNTTRGWYKEDLSAEGLKNLRKYVGKHIQTKNIHLELSKLAYASVANTVVLPMQDVLGLGKKARMNTPATAEGNWLWRLKPDSLTTKVEKRLKKWTKTYSRFFDKTALKSGDGPD